MKNYSLYETVPIADLRELTENCVRRYAGKAAFHVKESGSVYKTLTYEEFGRDLAALEAAFAEKGLAGKTVAVIGENCYEWVLVYLTVVNGNGIIVPIDKELPPSEVRSILERTEAGAVFHTQNYRETVETAADGLGFPLLRVNMTAEEGKSQAAEALKDFLATGRAHLEKSGPAPRAPVDREKACVILFTSGPTGKSKGVMLSHKALATNVVGACQMVGFTKEDILFSVLPIHHTYEGTCGILCMLHYGTTICFNDSLKNLVQNFRLFRPTGMFVVPMIAEALYARIWSEARKSGKEKTLRTGVRLSNFLLRLGIDIRPKLFRDVHAALGGRGEKIICGGA